VIFGEKVKQLRAERNLTQPQLAQAIGIEQSYLSKLENDKSVPSADIFQSILRAFSIDVGTFLEGVDDRIVHRDLKQVPEVANHLNTRITRKVHSIKIWLLASAIACTLGLTMVVAGYRGLLFSNTQYNYRSKGVVLPGEPVNIFDDHQGLLGEKRRAKLITPEEADQLSEEFSRRYHEAVLLLDEYRGDAFVQDVEGGKRLYDISREARIERPQNRWITLVGVLLTFGGILGFITEQRLRSVKL